MKFKEIAHIDHFDDATIFWAELSDVPLHIQIEAQKIDGAEYSATCFGMCINYDMATKEFAVVTDTDRFTRDVGNIYYVDNDGNEHWFQAEMPKEFMNQVFATCDKINTGRDTIHGYEVKKSVLFENSRGFALAENPKAVQPFVTWIFTEDKAGRRDYEWGHYYSDRAAAEKNFTSRAAEYQRDYGVREVKRPIAEQIKAAQKLAEENGGRTMPQKDAPDRNDR